MKERHKVEKIRVSSDKQLAANIDSLCIDGWTFVSLVYIDSEGDYEYYKAVFKREIPEAETGKPTSDCPVCDKCGKETVRSRKETV